MHPVWRNERGYFLVDQLEIVEGQGTHPRTDGPQKIARLSGFLRNSWGPENLGHITGYGDFQSAQIEGVVEIKGRPVLRLVKAALKSDDWRVLNERGAGMEVEVGKADTNIAAIGPGSIPEVEGDDEPEFDELAELKKDFQQLKFTAQDGKLIRR